MDTVDKNFEGAIDWPGKPLHGMVAPWSKWWSRVVKNFCPPCEKGGARIFVHGLAKEFFSWYAGNIPPGIEIHACFSSTDVSRLGLHSTKEASYLE